MEINQEDCKAIGIHLGTSHSMVGVWRVRKDGGLLMIINDHVGNKRIPNFVAFTADSEEILVGQEAKDQVLNNLTNTIYDVKRLIGRKFTDSVVQSGIKLWPFQVISDDHNKAMVSVEYKGIRKDFYPEEILSIILMNLKDIAQESGLGTVTNVVISVPSLFNDAQRQATKDAAKLAGFNVLRLINESSAAAFAYGYHMKSLPDSDQQSQGIEKNVMVFRLGSGCLDVSILNVKEDWSKYRVMGVVGDTHLGETDFDQGILRHCLNSIKQKRMEEIKNVDTRMRRLIDACEQVNRNLATATEDVIINLDSFYPDGTGFSSKISRSVFEDLNRELFKRCEDAVTECLYVSKMAASDVHEIILAGGGSGQVSKLQTLLGAIFIRNRISVAVVHPDTLIVQGAAIRAAIYGNIGIFSNFSLSEVTPSRLAIGTEITLVPRNTVIPLASTSPDFRTSNNYDSGCSIEIYEIEGEGIKNEDYHRLGKFELDIVPPTPAAVQLNVRFSVDTDRIFKIEHVKVKNSTREVICGSNTERFTEEGMEVMVQNADEIRSADNLAKKQRDSKRLLELFVNEYGPAEHFKKVFCKELSSDAKNKIQEVANWLLAGGNQLLQAEEYRSKIHDIVETSPEQWELFHSVGIKCILKANVDHCLEWVQRNADYFDPTLLAQLVEYSEAALKWLDSEQLVSAKEYGDRLSEFLEKFASAGFDMERPKLSV